LIFNFLTFTRLVLSSNSLHQLRSNPIPLAALHSVGSGLWPEPKIWLMVKTINYCHMLTKLLIRST